MNPANISKCPFYLVGITPNDVQEGIFGNVCQAMTGQNPTRQVVLGAGKLDDCTPDSNPDPNPKDVRDIRDIHCPIQQSTSLCCSLFSHCYMAIHLISGLKLSRTSVYMGQNFLI